MTNKPHHRKIYLVNLTPQEKDQLLKLTQKGQLSARKLHRAHILLLAHKGKTDPEIAEALSTSRPTVERTRKRFVTGGTIEAALNEKKRPGSKTKLDDKGQAILASVSESRPPKGRKRWTLRLLADRLVELKVVESISRETVRGTLKKTR